MNRIYLISDTSVRLVLLYDVRFILHTEPLIELGLYKSR